MAIRKERKLIPEEVSFIERKTDKFFEYEFGHYVDAGFLSIEPLIVEWKKKYNELMLEIVTDFYNWFENGGV